ncbi:MAG: hypothetical protein WCD89_02915 [Anaerocolumna sp.]
MKILCDSGLVDSSRVGKEMHYSLNKEEFSNAKKILDELFSKVK